MPPTRYYGKSFGDGWACGWGGYYSSDRSTPPQEEEFEPGDVVFHKEYGTGQVEEAGLTLIAVRLFDTNEGALVSIRDLEIIARHPQTA